MSDEFAALVRRAGQGPRQEAHRIGAQLRDAAWNNDAAEVRRCINGGVPVDDAGEHGYTRR